MLNYSILLSCFFISGVTALVYEVIWVRLLALTFGNTIFAIGIVLSAFMSGLSLGSYLFGRWADKGKNLLIGYGVLEFGIAVSAMLSPVILQRITNYYLSLSFSNMPILYISVVRYVLSFGVLLIPTTFMGGTLPILSKYLIRHNNELEKKLGILYSVNTFGGVLGAFVAGFFTIRLLGLTYALNITIVANVVIGATACYLGFRISHGPSMPLEPETIQGPRHQYHGYALFAFFFSGLAAMFYEVSWSRLLVGVIGSSTYSFSIILIGFLSGIAIGSLLVSQFSKRFPLSLFHFCMIEVLIGITCVVSLYLYPLLPRMMYTLLHVSNESYVIMMAISFLIVFVYLIIPTTMFGATFPIIASVYSQENRDRGKSIGNIYAVNTVGAILGSSFAAFFFLPSFGTTVTIKLAVLVNVMVGIIGFLFLKRKRSTVLALAVLFLALIPTSIPKEALVTGVAIYGTRSNYSLVDEKQEFLYFKEGLNATVAITTNRDSTLSLSTNGKVDASTRKDMSTQVGLGYFPLLLHPNPESVLIVGMGSGITLSAALDFQSVKSVETIEIEPAMIEAARLLSFANNNALDDPRGNIVYDDARAYIITSGKEYDVIISEPSNPWISGIGNLFSEEFYQTARSKLRKGGLFCQWVQLYKLNPNEVKMIVRTFSSVFPEVTIWQSNPADILLIGSDSDLQAQVYPLIGSRLKGRVSDIARSYLNIFDPMDFFSYYVTGKRGISRLASGAPLNTDDHPLLEFNAPFSLHSTTWKQNNELLHDLQELPAPIAQSEYDKYEEEFVFRKILNYNKLEIPISLSWLNNLEPGKFSYIANRKAALNPESINRHQALSLAMGYTSVRSNEDYEDMELMAEAIEYDISSGNIEKALDHLQQIEKAPVNINTHSKVYRLIARALIKENKYKMALQYLEKSTAINPYAVDTKIDLINAYKGLDMTDRACSLAKESVEMFYNHKEEILETAGDTCSPL